MGRLKAKETVVVEQGENAALSAPDEETIELDQGGRLLSLTKTIIVLLLSLVLVIVAVYTFLGITLMSAIPHSGGFTWVQRGTFVGGSPAQGDYIYASLSAQPIDDSVLGKLRQTYVGVDNAMVGKVIVGPYGNVTSNPTTGEIILDGNPTGVIKHLNKDVSLNKDYLVECVSSDSACKLGDVVLVKQSSIVGEAKYDITKSLEFTPYGKE